jgi:serine protease Do
MENNEFYFNNKKTFSFTKSILIPFCFGIVGTSLTIGICFGIPEIKNKLVGTNNTNTITTVSSTKTSSGVVDLVSLTHYSDTAVGVASKVLPSIVGISVEYNVNSVFGRNSSTATAKGSGIIISNDGYILTNNHIINSTSSSSYYQVSEASKLVVSLYNDTTEYSATIVGTDEVTDLAVIKIDKDGLTAAQLGDSSSIKIGEFCMAVGNPLDMESSVTCGVISALNRKISDSDGKIYTLLQTDAAINSGNSGGALVNSKGEVIGINTLKLSGTGIEGMGFAIPINSTVEIYEQLIKYSKVLRPYLGIEGIDLDEQTANRYNLPIGIYIKSIDDFSSAQKANLKSGDVILEFENAKITTTEELSNLINEKEIGDTVSIKIFRNDSEQIIEVTLLEKP